MKISSAVLTCFLIISSIPAQGLMDRFAQIRSDVETRKYPSAISSLRTLESADAEVFVANNFDYLLARLLTRTGEPGQAARYFQNVRARRSILREYATWHLASAARSSGNLTGERSYLMEILAGRHDSLLADAASRRLVESNFESGNYKAVIRSLSLGGSGAAGGPISRDSRLTLARAYLYNGDQTSARPIFEAIVASSPNPAQPDDLSLEAVKALDLMDVGSGRSRKDVGKLGDYEHLKRASIYQFNRDFEAARLHFLAILKDHSGSGLVPDAVYQIGRGYAQTGEYPEAVNWFERVGEQFPGHPVNRDALLQLASAYSRISKYRESVARYERFIHNYPGDERLDRAYLNIVDVLRDAGEETEAIQRADKTAEIFKGKTAEAQAVFVKARIRLARSDWANALVDLERLSGLKELGGASVPGGTTLSEVGFLRGMVLEQLKRFPDAVDAYLSLPHGRNEYYGWLAADRLRSMSSVAETKQPIDEKRNAISADASSSTGDARRVNLQNLIRIENDATVRTEHLEELKKLYATLTPYSPPVLPKLVTAGRNPRTGAAKEPVRDNTSIANELIFLGLYDEAAPEYEASVRGTTLTAKQLPRDIQRTVAQFYRMGDRADRGLAFADTVAKPPGDLEPESLPGEFAEMIYPAPYKDALIQHASSRGIDPRFVLSIMRQESGFRPNVKSVAAARGLMQFISNTSDRIAAELGRENFDQNELYFPPTAVLFGSQYISNLFKLFPGQPEAVAASYNGGEDNMKRWHGRARSDQPAQYVSEIGFSQSKDYVWRVMANYRMYQLLYDERLDRK